MARSVSRLTHHAVLLSVCLYMSTYGCATGSSTVPQRPCVCSCSAVSRTVAFLARRENIDLSQAALGPYSTDKVFIFNKLITNIGDSFDLATSKFTCKVQGVYVFSFSLLGHPSADMRVQLMLNGKEILYKFGKKPYGTVSGEATLAMKPGDQVWINQIKGYALGPWHQSFTGYLLPTTNTIIKYPFGKM